MECSFDSDKDEISSILFSYELRGSMQTFGGITFTDVTLYFWLSYELRDSIQTFGGVSKITLRVLLGLSKPT